MKIRHHGDFHLGQVLIAKDDAFILDFEGEPRRALAERRAKAPAARDVAGLLRSIDYAASARLSARAQPHARRTRNPDAADARHGAARWPRATGTAIAKRSDSRRSGRPTTRQAQSLLDFFLLEKAFYEIEYELTNRPAWARNPTRGDLAHPAAARSGPVMSTLSPAARAIIAGRHPDPFNYLGPHTENDKTDRARVPAGRAPRRRRRRERRARTCRASTMPDCSPARSTTPHYRLRARFGDNEVELEDAYRFPPILSDFDLYLLGEGNHLRLYDKLGAHPMRSTASTASPSWSARRMRGASASSATSISGTAAATPCACAATAIGKFSCRARAPATNTNTRSSPATARCCR